MPANLFERVIHPDERIVLFIDGANLFSAARALNFDIDYRKLLDGFKANGRLIRANYYTALLEHDDFSPIRPLVDWLDYNGYRLVTKPAREYTDSTGRRRVKGDMDIEIAVEALEAAASCDHIFLFSGDGDFTALVESIQRKGVKVSVVSTIRANPPMAADELRRQADQFIDLVELAPFIGRPPRERAPERVGATRHDDDDDDA